MIVRPKTTVIYFYGIDYKCTVACHPQQRWKCTAEGNKVTLRRKNTTIEISKADFDRDWIEVDNGKNTK